MRIQLTSGGSITDAQKRRLVELQTKLKTRDSQATDAEQRAKDAESTALEKDKLLAELLAKMQQYEKVSLSHIYCKGHRL